MMSQAKSGICMVYLGLMWNFTVYFSQENCVSRSYFAIFRLLIGTPAREAPRKFSYCYSLKNVYLLISLCVCIDESCTQ